VFCDPFDEALAERGPAGVFLFDQEGLLRFDPEWTRDAWVRSPGPHTLCWRWVLLRDHDTGFVQLVLSTARDLLVDHPRMDLRVFTDLEEAREVRASFGSPPVCPEPW
jgi:hypothetical protein